MIRRIAPFALAATLVVGMIATIGSAGPNTLEDPNDVVGVLDVETVRWSDLEGEPPEWKIVTFGGWTVRKIWDRGYLYVLIDTMGTEPAEYAAQVRSDGRKIHGTLFRLGKRPNERDRVVSSLTVRKGNPTSVSVRIPLHRLRFDRERTFYRYWVVTTFSSDKCPAVCIDRAPDTGSVQRFLPGASPTPTPTP